MVCKGGGLATITSLKLLKMRKVYIDGRKNHVRWIYGMSKKTAVENWRIRFGGQVGCLGRENGNQDY